MSLHYNAANSFLYANGLKIQTELNGKVCDFSVSYETIDFSDIENIHKYLMKKHKIVKMSGFIEQMFIVLVLVLFCFGGSLVIKCVPLNNQPCMIRLTLIDLNPDEFLHYPFIVNMTRCDESCNTVEDRFG